MNEQKQIEEMAKIMLEQSQRADVEPVLEVDGKEIVLGENATIILNNVLEQAFIPFLANALYNADYRKVEQGEWKDVKRSYATSLGGKGTSPYRVCSVCEWEYPVVTVGQHLKKYKYCPYCGAKMRGE